MENLKILDYYNNANDDKVNVFNNKVSSSLRVVTDYDKVDCDYEWLEKMEDTIRYLDNILRNPNRFIVNEEEIVKIELCRRVTVESIKHLSRNTNLIQDIDKKTGDVRPSKILNINKEESFNTYENRFIYSLIQNMRSFINRKKSMGEVGGSSLKDNKSFQYTGATKIGNENVDINMEMNSKISSKGSGSGDSASEIQKRIERLELQITDLTNSDVYKTLARLHVAMVTSPIKKTNLILKNVNFQYALNLWNYLQMNMDSSLRRTKDNKNYMDNGDLKNCIDESFMLNYLVMDSLNSNKEEVDKKELTDKLVGNMIQQVMAVSGGEVTQDDINDAVARQFTVIKYKSIVSDREIQKIFRKHIEKYLGRINNIKI